MEHSGSLSFLDIKLNSEKTSLLPYFTESLHLLEFLLIFKVLFPSIINVFSLILCYIEDSIYAPIWEGLTVCSYHVTYEFQRESTLYSCLNVTELLARSRCEIWSLSDCNWTRTHNHLVHKRTLNRLAIWLNVWFS